MLAIVLHFDLEAHGLEVIGYKLAKLGVVVDDEEAHGDRELELSVTASFFTSR
jgi:hypothetical protein